MKYTTPDVTTAYFCRYIAYLQNRLMEQQDNLDVAMDTPQADVVITGGNSITG